MMKRMALLAVFLCVAGTPLLPQEATIAPADNLIVDGVPKISASIADVAGRYGSYRSATIVDWHPVRREMLIATRFAETPQLHLLKMPFGDRQMQLRRFCEAC